MNESSEAHAKKVPENDPVASKQFVHYVALPTLQDMASHRIALAIWCSYISSHSKPIKVTDMFCEMLRDDFIHYLGIENSYWQGLGEMMKSLKTPGTIENILKFGIDAVVHETNMCIKYFQREVFSNHLHKYRIEHFDMNWCVWLGNVKIDYARTGAKMLSASELSEAQKFVIMCEFCMEEEIRKFPLDSFPNSFIKKLSFHRASLTHYWICYLKNELHEIPLGDFSSIDVLMACTYDKPCWAAFEYFWQRLGDNDKVSVAELKLGRHHTPIYHQELILSTMSLKQQLLLLSIIPERILINFLNHFVSNDSVMWAWNNSKDLITPEQFAEVVIEVFRRKIRFEEVICFLLEIWHSASDDQRSHVIETTADEIIRTFLRTSGQSKAAFEFLFVLLSMKSDDFRKATMLQQSDQVADIEDLDSMGKIIKLCFPIPADQLEYKSRIMGSFSMQERAVELFRDGNFESLIRKLKFYSADAETAREFVKKLLGLKGIAKKEYVTNVEKWNKFSQFINEMTSCFCTDDQDIFDLLQMKKQLIFSFAENCPSYWNRDISQFRKVIEQELTFEELTKLKVTLLNAFQKVTSSMEYWVTFEARYIVDFLSWSLDGDEEKIKEFKKTIPIDELFDKAIKDMNGNGFRHEYETLDGFNKCLRWYFVEDDLAKVYKIRRMYEFDMESLCRLLPQYATGPWRELAQKLFDGDLEEIRKFGLRQWKHECKKKGMKFPSDGK